MIFKSHNDRLPYNEVNRIVENLCDSLYFNHFMIQIFQMIPETRALNTDFIERQHQKMSFSIKESLCH